MFSLVHRLHVIFKTEKGTCKKKQVHAGIKDISVNTLFFVIFTQTYQGKLSNLCCKKWSKYFKWLSSADSLDSLIVIKDHLLVMNIVK